MEPQTKPKCPKCGHRMYRLRTVKQTRVGEKVVKQSNCRHCGYKEVIEDRLSRAELTKIAKKLSEKELEETRITVPTPPAAPTVNEHVMDTSQTVTKNE